MSKDRKPFKDSKLFNVIKNVAPQVLDTATDIMGDIYPPLEIVNKVVDKAIGVAQSNKDPEAVAQLTAGREDYLKEVQMYLNDVQDARSMYENSGHAKADQIATSVINWNLWLILGLVVVQVLSIMYVDGKVSAVISGIIGTAVGNLFQERNTVIGFFFGSSKGSKDKDKKN